MAPPAGDPDTDALCVPVGQCDAVAEAEREGDREVLTDAVKEAEREACDADRDGVEDSH